MDITPKLGQMMPGYFNKRFGSGILDPLYTKALVLENDGTRIAVAAVDCLKLSDDAVADFRKKLSARTGIENALLAATHAHTGGPVEDWGSHMKTDNDYVGLLVDKSVDAVVMAIEKLQPATLRTGREYEDGISFNRRFHMADGNTATNPGIKNPGIVKPCGPIDPDVTVLRIDGPDGNLIGVLTNFSCHLDVVGGDKLCSDYPGELSRALKSIYGQHIVSMFLTAPCGDINHIDVSGVFCTKRDHYKRLGRALAGKVVSVMEKAPMMADNTLGAKREVVVCSCRQPSTSDVEAARAHIAAEKRPYDELAYVMDNSQTDLFYALETVRMYENPQSAATLEVMAVRIGGLSIVTIPGELFVEFSIAIKAASGFDYTMVSSLTNGSFGYILTREALECGGYERRLCSSSKMSADTGYVLVDTAKMLLAELLG